jgi:hypothetical protein
MRLSLLFPAGLLLGAATSVLAYDPNMTVQVVDNMADTGAAEGLGTPPFLHMFMIVRLH